eukprot:95836_1
MNIYFAFMYYSLFMNFDYLVKVYSSIHSIDSCLHYFSLCMDFGFKHLCIVIIFRIFRILFLDIYYLLFLQIWVFYYIQISKQLILLLVGHPNIWLTYQIVTGLAHHWVYIRG